MTKEIELLIKKSTLRDVEIAVKKVQLDGEVIPDNVIEILRNLEKEYTKKEPECEQGHICTSDCQKTVDCPCLTDHCCSMTPKEDLCGELDSCEFCASKVPDLADLQNDNLNER